MIKNLIKRAGCVFFACALLSSVAYAVDVFVFYPGSSLSAPNFAITVNNSVCGGCGSDYRIPIVSSADFNGACSLVGNTQSMIACSTVKTDVAFTSPPGPPALNSAVWVVDKPRQCLGNATTAANIDFAVNVIASELTVEYRFKNTGAVFRYTLQTLPAGTTSCVDSGNGFDCTG